MLLDQEAPKQDGLCQHCGTRNLEARCLDCHGRPELCIDCSLQLHSNHPFHQVERWTGTFFKRCGLINLGYVLCLGHAGKSCSSARPEGVGETQTDPTPQAPSTHSIAFVDVCGVFEHNVLFCQCKNALEPWMQLFMSGYFPASTHTPKTAFSFRVLDDFFLECMECHTPAMSYMAKLGKATDAVFPHDVKVCSWFYLQYLGPTLLGIVGQIQGAVEDS